MDDFGHFAQIFPPVHQVSSYTRIVVLCPKCPLVHKLSPYSPTVLLSTKCPMAPSWCPCPVPYVSLFSVELVTCSVRTVHTAHCAH